LTARLQVANPPEVAPTEVSLLPVESVRPLHPLSASSPMRSFSWRIASLAALFAVEGAAISLWLDGELLTQSHGLTRAIGKWAPDLVRGAIAFAIIFFTFAFLQRSEALRRVAEVSNKFKISPPLLAGHIGAMLSFLSLSALLFRIAPKTPNDVVAAAWLLSGMTAVALAALAFVPFIAWVDLIRRTGRLWAYAAAVAVVACSIGDVARVLWRPASVATFYLVRALLGTITPNIIADWSAMRLGTPNFHVVIAPECSGLEGAGLILAFGLLWLLLFRRECRFPHSLLLLPAAVALSFLLNIVRITALILIGNAGFREMATRGFHSQAGWIFFNGVAAAFCLVLGRVSLFSVSSRSEEVAQNPSTAYLLPFLAILAAGLISGAATASFEWLYPLRFLAAALALWMYRKRYSALNWNFGGTAVLAGALVALVWIGFDRVLGIASSGMPADLLAAPLWSRLGWLAFRVIATCLTVPIAEELAFRGFLMRRLVSAEFDSVSFRRVSILALLLSSVLFGALHGHRWIPGVLAGLVFGFLAMRRGRLGDAVAAHATANIVIAAYVLVFHNWSLW